MVRACTHISASKKTSSTQRRHCFSFSFYFLKKNVSSRPSIIKDAVVVPRTRLDCGAEMWMLAIPAIRGTALLCVCVCVCIILMFRLFISILSLPRLVCHVSKPTSSSDPN